MEPEKASAAPLPAPPADSMTKIVDETLKTIIGGDLPPGDGPITLPAALVRAMIKKSLIFDCLAKLVVKKQRGQAIRILDSLPHRKDIL